MIDKTKKPFLSGGEHMETAPTFLPRREGMTEQGFSNTRMSFIEILSKGGVILLGNVVQAFGLILTVRVSTELLSPSQLGGVTQMYSLANLFYMLLSVPVFQYVVRRFCEWYDGGNLSDYIRRYFYYTLVVAAIASLVAWIVQSQFHIVSGFSTGWVVILVVIYLLSVSISTLGTMGLNLLNHRFLFVLFSNIPVWVGLGISFVLFKEYESPSFWSLGLFAGFSFACLSFFILVRYFHGIKQKPRTGDVKSSPFAFNETFGFAWPLFITNTFGWSQYQSYKFILDKIKGSANVGLFSIGYGIGSSIITMYEGVFSQFYAPIYYNELKGQGVKGQTKAWNNYASAYIPGVVLVGVFVASNARFLVQVMLGEQFREAANTLIIWAAIIESIRAATSMVSYLGFAKMDTRIAILPVAAGGILAPLCVFIFGSIDPISGTAFGFFMAYLAVFIIAIVKIQKALPVTWPVRQIFLAGLFSAPLIIAGQFVMWVQPHPTTFLSVLVLLLGGVYVIAIQALMLKSQNN